MIDHRGGRRKANRRTASYYLECEHIDGVKRLCALGVFESESHAVDTALSMFLATYRPVIDALAATESEGEAA